MAFERACSLSDVAEDEALGVTVGAYEVAFTKDLIEFINA